MNSRPTLHKVAALLAAIPLTCPGWNSFAFASEPAAGVPTPSHTINEQQILDVVLFPGNRLAGEVVDSSGLPQPNADVVVSLGRHEINRGMTNQSGKFLIEVPRGGVYLVTAGGSAKVVRTWTATVAPPVSKDHVTLAPPAIIRGQNPNVGSSAMPGLLLAAGIAAAIAIPIALSTSRAGDRSSHTSNTAPPPPAGITRKQIRNLRNSNLAHEKCSYADGHTCRRGIKDGQECPSYGNGRLALRTRSRMLHNI